MGVDEGGEDVFGGRTVAWSGEVLEDAMLETWL